MSRLRRLAAFAAQNPKLAKRAFRVAGSIRRGIERRLRRRRTKVRRLQSLVFPRPRYRLETVKEAQAPPAQRAACQIGRAA